jgi:hypothetical protein
LTVDGVERPKGTHHAVFSKSFEEHNGVEIVAHRVPRRKQPRFDASHFGERRDAQTANLLRLQWTRAPELPNTGQDAIQLPENQHRPLYSLRLPTSHRLQRRQHFVETSTEIFKDVIAIQTDSMPRVHGGGRSTHENRARHEMLQMPFGGKQSFPIWNLTQEGGHRRIVTWSTCGRGLFDAARTFERCGAERPLRNRRNRLAHLSVEASNGLDATHRFQLKARREAGRSQHDR